MQGLFRKSALFAALAGLTFAAHATNDTDVPFDEFRELITRYNPRTFIAACNVHDFDREADNQFTPRLLDATIDFLEKHI